MESYYRGLLAHMEKRAARRSTDPEAVDKERDRMMATQLDRAAKLEDLVRKYSLRVQLGLTQVLVVPLPVRAISVRLIRKKQERPMLLHWNAISRALDTPLCEACSARARPLHLCEKVHLLCGACWSPCPECSRVFCRACQPRCKCAASSGRISYPQEWRSCVLLAAVEPLAIPAHLCPAQAACGSDGDTRGTISGSETNRLD